MPNLFFYGLQPFFWSRDRLYRLYVSDTMLAGAWIAGQIYDRQTARIQLQQLHILLFPLVRRWLARRNEQEKLYDSIDPFGPELLEVDKRNFQIRRSNVAWTRLRRNRSLHTTFNVGVFELGFSGTGKMRLILVGDQNPDSVLEMLRRFDPTIEVTGKPAPRLIQTFSPRQIRLRYVVMAALLLVSGFVVGYCAFSGVVAGQKYWPLATLNVLVGGWCLAKARKLPVGPSEPPDPSQAARSA
jgi:hypothetical protein